MPLLCQVYIQIFSALKDLQATDLTAIFVCKRRKMGIFDRVVNVLFGVFSQYQILHFATLVLPQQMTLQYKIVTLDSTRYS